jgi:hypothetical protein
MDERKKAMKLIDGVPKLAEVVRWQPRALAFAHAK